MPPSQDEIYTLLQHAHKPLHIDALLRMLHVARAQKKTLEKLLYTLEDANRVVRLRGGRWQALDGLRTITGRYTVLRSGDGYVTPSGEKHTHGKKPPPQQPSVFVRAGQSHDAWHGDMVTVVLFPQRNELAPEGRIISVVARHSREVAAYVLKERGAGTILRCQPADPRLSFLLDVDVGSLPQRPKKGELLLTQPHTQKTPQLWEATALRNFGREDDVAVQENLVKCNHQCPADFPLAVLEEAAQCALPAEATAPTGREDVRHIPFVTIDGATAKDFDDAIYVCQQSQGWELWVGIADVTHYVQPHSALDTEARLRGNSWYFPTSVTPMLPPELSDGVCSLTPHEDKYIMLVRMRIDAHGNIAHSHFTPAILRSHARLTYDQVKELVIDASPAAREVFIQQHTDNKDILLMLDAAVPLARLLTNKRIERGALDFNIPEPEYIFDAQGAITNITRKEHHFAHQLIEAFMVTANEAVAAFLTQADVPFVYRVHPEPDPQRLEGLMRTLASTSLAPDLPAKVDSNIIRTALHAAHGSPLEFFAARLALRAMPQARYQPDHEGHFGLASSCYCHFTSPIRRYADIIVHRALKHALGLQQRTLPAGKTLLAQADHINRCERAAMEAEREMARRLATLLLRHRVGEIFDGTISGVTDFGCFVELACMPVEGMIRIDSLGNDFFVFDAERQELTGHISGVCYALGQQLRTRLVDVHVGRLEITLELADMPGTNTHKGTRQPKARRKKQSLRRTSKSVPQRTSRTTSTKQKKR